MMTMEANMTINDKVRGIQALMEKDGLDAYIIYGSDPHNSEYVCPRWRTREFITGFSGSAGTVMITRSEALLWVDSRYNIQAAEQIKGTVFKLFRYDDPGVMNFKQYLEAHADDLHVLGTAADCLMKTELDDLETKGFTVVPAADYLDRIWTDRPPVPFLAVRRMDDKLCGFSASEKLEQLRGQFDGLDYMFISSLDDIAWVLNLRGQDIAYNPVFLSYLLVGKDDAVLFADSRRFSKDMMEAFKPFLKVRPYESVCDYLKALPAGSKVGLDFKRTNMLVYNAFPASVVFRNQMDKTTEMKACKNEAELAGMRQAHVLDGVALVNFLAKVEANPSGWTEMKLTDALQEERDKLSDSRGPSFGPIAGYAEHGAMCHYSATKESSSAVKRGLVVLDTGGHYEMGMTDVTRTLCFGEPTADEKRDYTLVLKGHLALFRTHFPEGTSGLQLDALARQFLWNNGLTYSHGTGHGVGFCLCVHEGPMSISYRPNALYPLKEGMVISDEPGLYLEGRHGIRIENLVAVQKAETTEFGNFFKFEFLTMCPYERRLIDKSMLTDEEERLVNDYHAEVLEKLSPLVNPEALDYLKRATRPL